MSKHTPGPWKYGVRRDKSIWLSIGDPEKGPHRQGDLYASEADARLIAAAPELLDVVNDILRVEDGKAALSFSEYFEQSETAFNRMRAVVAKAEGRS
ncbi:hypothetical protein [Ensifer adhaerens]|uniref:hypothetical protein n=1 Tax=Ensifer adhaerens TaxID=106592 RepID=UPI000CF061D8|nr:hypothetical protein [Ensifer adhaerens]